MDRERRELVENAIRDVQPTIERISSEVWDLAEISSAEVESSAVHLRELQNAGFTVVSRDTSGRPNAFVAEWERGQGGPRVGFLPEYDALPGLGNAAVPRPEPAANGKTSGHACGHNLLGASCTGAAIALKALMEREGIDGLVRVYGCAAEENKGAKVWMARDGLFDDLDACLAWHSGPIATTGFVRTTANNQMTVEFFGKSAHAGMEPWSGRSALHALELFVHGVNLMREHVKPSTRMHYIVEAGGEAANIVPDYTRLSFRIRDPDRAAVEATTQWARELAAGVAMGTQTTATLNVRFGCADLLPNKALIERTYAHLVDVGVPEWTEEEQSFARECQRQMGLAEAGLATTPYPLIPDMALGGSTDVGDVSWNTPTGVFVYPSLPIGVSLHSWAVTACGGMSIGTKAAIGAATILTRVGLDVVTDADLRASARADFDERRAGKTYVAALPADDATSMMDDIGVRDAADEMVPSA